MSAPRPHHLRRTSSDKRTICGLRDPDDTPYCLLGFAERHRPHITEFCETCWAETLPTADTAE